MIRFQQTFGAHTGRICELEQDLITFGRLPGCDVSFDPQADLDASGKHAEVRREGDAWMVIDVGSRNGTWLNGQRVQRAVLSSGDELEFGHGGPRLRVEIPSAEGPRVTGPMTPARPDQPTAAATAVPPAGAGSRPDIDTSAPTLMAESHPPPGGGQPVTPIPMSSPPGPLGGWGQAQPPEPQPTPQQAHQSQSGYLPGYGAPPTGPPPPPEGEKKYGQKTVAMMVQSAIAEAERNKSQGGRGSTAFLRAIASEAATSSSRGLRIVVAILSLLFLLAVAAIVGLIVMNLRGTQQARQGDLQLQNQVAQGPAGARIAAAYNGAIHLLVEQAAEGEPNGLCTAFAVRNDLLATNGSCVVAMERRGGTGATYRALPNGGGEPLSIVQMWRHPGYTIDGDGPSADIGIVQVNGELPVTVTLSDMQHLQRLQVGDDIFVFGFSGDLVNVRSPAATITNGVVGRMVAFDGSVTGFPTAQLIRHSASTGQGARGSPIFDRHGVVIGINAGSFRAASGGEYGLRIDLLTSLLAGMNR